MKKTIRIHKIAGTKKDAIRVLTESDIPNFLKSSIVIDGDKLHITCVEGDQTAPLGTVIGYEKSDSTNTGWNCWCIWNAATNLIEKDGVFYKKATVFEAQPIDDEFPEFLEGADITHNPDGSWSIKSKGNTSTGFPGKAYWVKHGIEKDGTISANILTKSELSYREYIVCDENGNDLGLLCELDQ